MYSCGEQKGYILGLDFYRLLLGQLATLDDGYQLPESDFVTGQRQLPETVS